MPSSGLLKFIFASFLILANAGVLAASETNGAMSAEDFKEQFKKIQLDSNFDVDVIQSIEFSSNDSEILYYILSFSLKSLKSDHDPSKPLFFCKIKNISSDIFTILKYQESLERSYFYMEDCYYKDRHGNVHTRAMDTPALKTSPWFEFNGFFGTTYLRDFLGLACVNNYSGNTDYCLNLLVASISNSENFSAFYIDKFGTLHNEAWTYLDYRKTGRWLYRPYLAKAELDLANMYTVSLDYYIDLSEVEIGEEVIRKIPEANEYRVECTLTTNKAASFGFFGPPNQVIFDQATNAPSSSTIYFTHEAEQYFRNPRRYEDLLCNIYREGLSKPYCVANIPFSFLPEEVNETTSLFSDFTCRNIKAYLKLSKVH